MSDIQSFIANNLSAAQAAASQLGTDPAHVLGQWGLETGWGQHVIPGTNNLGNIKSTNGSGVAATDNQLGTNDKYAAYATPGAASAAYSNLLHNPRYQGVVGSGDNTGAFINGLVQGGYAQDPNYGSKLNSAIGMVKQAGAAPSLADMKAQLAQQVTEDYANGVKPETIISGLLNTNLAGADVKAALAKGVDPQRIIQVVGGAPFAHFQATDPGEKVKQQGFLTNLAQGASNAVSDLSQGAQQLAARLSGNDAQLQQLQAAQAAAQADPGRQALSHTWGGNIGSGAVDAIPYVVGTALAPEAAIPMMAVNAGVGAGMGALKPTTGSGQILGNIGADAAMGALGAGAGVGLSKLAGAAIGGNAGATARLADAQAQGLPASVASISKPGSFWRGIADSMPENGSVHAFQNSADQAVAAKVAEGLGLQGYAGPIDTNMLDAARQPIKDALDSATNFQVTLPNTLKGDLDTLISTNSNPLTEGIEQTGMVKTAAANLSKAAEAGTPVSGQQLQGLASELKGLIYNPSASFGEKQLAGKVVDQIHDTLTSAMTPEQQAAFEAANGQYRNLLAVQKMVSGTNNTGVVTPRAMLQAIKTGQTKSAFLKGDAPYQDLAGTAADLYGPAAGKGLGQVIGKAIGGDHSLMAAAVLEPHSGVPMLLAKKAASAIAGKLAASQNPTVMRILTGAGGSNISPEMAAYISKALAATGSGSAPNA